MKQIQPFVNPLLVTLPVTTHNMLSLPPSAPEYHDAEPGYLQIELSDAAGGV